MKLISRRLTNGWLHCHCKTCGAVKAVTDVSAFVCFCPPKPVEVQDNTEEKIPEPVESVAEETKSEPAKKPRRRRKPRAKVKKTEEK